MSLSVYTDLSPVEIDVRVKLVCEKPPPLKLAVHQILALVSAEERMVRLKVIKS